jgi:hypothetical protein
MVELSYRNTYIREFEKTFYDKLIDYLIYY